MKVTLFERDDQEGYEYEPNGEVLRPERVVIIVANCPESGGTVPPVSRISDFQANVPNLLC